MRKLRNLCATSPRRASRSILELGEQDATGRRMPTRTASRTSPINSHRLPASPTELLFRQRYGQSGQQCRPLDVAVVVLDAGVAGFFVVDGDVGDPHDLRGERRVLHHVVGDVGIAGMDFDTDPMCG